MSRLPPEGDGMENIWAVTGIWMGLALMASLISIRLGISVALAEIMVGALGGNYLGLQTGPWIDFLAAFGAILLTFLAGAEIDPVSFRRHLKTSLAIGTASFALPFFAAWAFALFVAHWDLRAAQIAGVALSTTSVAVVYAVMVETGLNETDLGKLILASCFITDLGTVLMLGVLFAGFNRSMVIFIAVVIPTLWLLPKISPWVLAHLKKGVTESGVKFFLLVLFALAWLATSASVEAVLPAYLIGLVSAGVFVQEKALLHKIRTVAFAVLKPFYFLKAGLFISFQAVVAGFLWILAFLGVKVGAKFAGVLPLAHVMRFSRRDAHYTTLLMSTGLTFGTISALFGFTHNVIDRNQYTILVTVVLGSAVVPTLIAQAFFKPRAVPKSHHVETHSEMVTEPAKVDPQE